MGDFGPEGGQLSRVKNVAGFRWFEMSEWWGWPGPGERRGPGSGRGLVRSDRVVFDPVVLGVFGEHDDVIDFAEIEPLVFQGAESSFA